MCSEQVDVGACDQWQTKYYYDARTHRCQPFTYGGCDGSANRFNTKSECESICNRQDPANNKGITAFALNAHSNLLLPFELGLCNNIEYEIQNKRWYYDDSQDSCMPFIHGGCMGNKNNSQYLDSCMQFCGNSKLS